ncbi:MAG: ATP-grasp domain-containing protein [Planctomycetaceae bacterium]
MSMSESPGVLIFGGATRAACWSAARAGLTAVCFDLFADCDFPPGAVVHKIASMTDGNLLPVLEPFLRSYPAAALLPVGGGEYLSETLGSSGRVLGSRPSAISRARDPRFVWRFLANQGLPTLPLRLPGEPVSGESAEKSRHPSVGIRWLRKSITSVGGLGIRRLAAGDLSPVPAGFYDQGEVDGIPCSAQFLTCANARGEVDTELLGCTRQIIGSPELPARPFAYAGNLFPLQSFEAIDRDHLLPLLHTIGRTCALACGLRGLWGLDFVLAGQTPYLVEINPRYTAALELMELAEQRSLLRDLPGLAEGRQVPPRGERSKPTRSIGKRILYASRDFELPCDWSWDVVAGRVGQGHGGEGERCWSVPTFSDLPAAGTAFRREDPICTIWATGDTGADCLEQLRCPRNASAGPPLFGIIPTSRNSAVPTGWPVALSANEIREHSEGILDRCHNRPTYESFTPA